VVALIAERSGVVPEGFLLPTGSVGYRGKNFFTTSPGVAMSGAERSNSSVWAK
jgi:hypothetical protein